MPRALLALALAACEPEAPPSPYVPAGPGDRIDCTAPPPVPRCPAESSPSCAALWDKVAAWREACPDAFPPAPGEE